MTDVKLQFNYIALATVLVATLPANGILLQNAITAVNEVVTLPSKPVTFAVSGYLPAGATAFLNEDGTVSIFKTDWQQIMPFVVGNVDGLYKQSAPSNTTCEGECLITHDGIGFDSTCYENEIPFNMTADNYVGNNTIFSSAINWNHNHPYRMSLNTVWKDVNGCDGVIKNRTCSLQLGRVRYRSTVRYNFTDTDGEYWSWVNQDRQDVLDEFTSGNEKHAIRFVPASNFTNLHPESDDIPTDTDTMYGGIAFALASYYNSTVAVQSTSEETFARIDGFYAQQLDLGDFNYTTDDYCYLNFNSFGLYWQYETPYDDLLDQIQQTLYFTSIWAASVSDYVTNNKSADFWSDGTWPKPAFANMEQPVVQLRYRVIWYWWGASCAVTLCIVLFILPTFYGFWTLARKTTLSPFETARAFHAPVLHDQPMHLDTPTLLKTVGTKNLHEDLGTLPVVQKSG
jgi:hypothetical protein